MKSAYYSRNNSYSRSYNATVAENEERFPLTRAADFLGLSVKAFKAGCKNANYNANEWHHVGKFANKVDYYDTTILNNNFKFWIGARNKSNKEICNENLKRIASENLAKKVNVSGPKSHVIINAHYFNDLSFTVELQKETDKNLQKAFKDILRKYIVKPLKIELKQMETETTQCFILFPNGDLFTKNLGRRVYANEINWNNYQPNTERMGGIMFSRIK